MNLGAQSLLLTILVVEAAFVRKSAYGAMSPAVKPVTPQTLRGLHHAGGQRLKP